jgi:hypothetical protein
MSDNYTREGFRLTPIADADAAEYMANFEGCSCHISAPCSSCVHPGNPNNLAEDDTAWEIDQEWIVAGEFVNGLIGDLLKGVA